MLGVVFHQPIQFQNKSEITVSWRVLRPELSVNPTLLVF